MFEPLSELGLRRLTAHTVICLICAICVIRVQTDSDKSEFRQSSAIL